MRGLSLSDYATADSRSDARTGAAVRRWGSVLCAGAGATEFPGQVPDLRSVVDSRVVDRGGGSMSG
jgi:hypothetical protein